jgi:PAS domain S-box-containing protein
LFEKFSFRSRLLLWIMPTLILGLLILSVGTYLYVKNLIEKEFTDHMLTATGKTADGMNTWLKTLILEPETIASTSAAKAINTDFSLIDSQNINRHKILHRNYPDIFQDIYAANRYGIYHTVRENGNRYFMFTGNIANRDYFKSIMSGGPAQITSPLISRTTGIPTIFIVAPIKDDKGRPQGLVGAGISLNYIRVVAEGLKAYSTGYGVVVDKDGRLIYHPDNELVLQRKLTEFDDPTVRELGNRMTSGGSGVFRYTYNGLSKIAFYQPIAITGWSVATVVPEVEMFASAVRLLRVVAGITLLLALIVGLIILVTANRLTQPLQNLASHALQIASGNLNPGTLKVKQHDEIGTLTETFNTMTTNLSSTMEILRSSENKYRSLIDNISIGIYRSSLIPQNRYIQVNPAMVKMFGFDSEEELLNIRPEDLYNDPAEMLPLLDEIQNKGYVRDSELCFRTKAGNQIWCSVTANAEYDNDGNLKWINGFIEEITERKKLSEQLRQSQKMEAIGTLAGGIAHDFNNILTAIIGYATLFKLKLSRNDLEVHYIDDILEAADRATNLTGSLLTFSRKQIISLKPVSLNDTVKRLESFLLRVIGEDIDFKTQLCSEELIIMADAGQIEQMLVNLAANARDAMPDGGLLSISIGRIDVNNEMPVSALEPGAYAFIEVSDTGWGMEDATRQRIFEPFFTTKEIGKGTGLGLSIVYGIVKQHNGEIQVYSEPGFGTTFKIYQKLVNLKAELSTDIRQEKPYGGTETILIAEDDPAVRKLFREILEGLGYKIIEASDGDDAVAKYIENREKIKLLLFDVIMPKKNGKEAYEEIKKAGGNARIIFSSGYTADIISRKGFGDNVNLISKPVNPAALASKVREVLDS